METLDNNKTTTIDKLTDHLVKMLESVVTCPNSHLSYNLTLLAALTDATHLRKVMEVMLANWSNALPFLGDEGVDTDWNMVKERIWKVQVMIDKERHHPIKINIPSPLPEGIEEWSYWQSLVLDGEGKVNSHSYKKELNPIEQNNLFYFASYDYDLSNNMPNGSTNYMRVLLRHMTAKEHPQLKNFFFYEMERIQQLADNLQMLLHDPSRIILPENEQDSLVNNFVDHIQGMFSFKVNLRMYEYRSWYKRLKRKMDEKMLLRQRNSYWNDVVASGFLEPLYTKYPQSKGDDNFMSYFFSNNDLKTRIAGCYIYIHQLDYPDWNHKVEKFLFFVAVNRQIEKDISELPQEKRTSVKTAQDSASIVDQKRQKIAACIFRLMNEKDEDGDFLMKYGNQWIAIHRVLVDFCGFPDCKAEFQREMKELEMKDARLPCTIDRIAKISNKVIYSNFKKWEQNKTSTNVAFLRQYKIAVRFLELLKEEGLLEG